MFEVSAQHQRMRGANCMVAMQFASKDTGVNGLRLRKCARRFAYHCYGKWQHF